MKRVAAAVVLAVSVLVMVLPGRAAAHPLGNFTVNHYAGIEIAGDVVYVRFSLDLAEIPTFQVGSEVRARGFARAIAEQLELRIDDRRSTLTTLASRTSGRPGAGGLPTLRFDAVFVADASAGARLEFVDATFAQRIGWREITIAARDGARLLRSSAPARTSSNALRSYPADQLQSPPDVRSASARFEPGTTTGSPPALSERAEPAHRRGGFESLIERDLSLIVVVLSLLVAAFWGAAHALTPGHGKALVAGYLVGSRGRPRDAVVLGATVTVTHTAGVFMLGFVTLLLSRFIVPEQLYPWLTLVSGLLVVAVGITVLRARLRGVSRHGHDHPPGHHHSWGEDPDEHHHRHHHDGHGVDAVTSRGILGIGVAAGLLPCPSALVVLLSAIALHRIGFGIALIVAFSVGIAATITGIGLVAVLARRAFRRVSFDGPLVRLLPTVSAAVILGVGALLTARALPGVI
jgi:ABC-type nickel/cobalt efflux system permease component RcnA